MTVVVRSARASDHERILALVRAAFSDDTHDGEQEVEIVRETWSRQAAPPHLELVAETGHAIVGHVLAAIGHLGGRPAIGIAPLAVAPEHQRQGVGTALMTELLARLQRNGWPIAVLLGDPRYYSRFGFEPSAPWGITYQPVGPGNPHFMVRRFSSGDFRGDFTYCWELPES